MKAPITISADPVLKHFIKCIADSDGTSQGTVMHDAIMALVLQRAVQGKTVTVDMLNAALSSTAVRISMSK